MRRTMMAVLVVGVVGFTLSPQAVAQNIRGSATWPTTAKGYDHPGQYLHVQDVSRATRA